MIIRSRWTNAPGMNSPQKVAQSIDQPFDLRIWLILETPFHGSHNNSHCPAFQISPMQFDWDWEETLNDIDELIQSELRCTRPLYGTETQPFGETRVEQSSAPEQVWTNDLSKKPSTDREWSFTGNAFCKFHWLSFVTGQREIQRIIGAGLLLQSSTKCNLEATLK